MHAKFAELAVEALKAMYEHNSNRYTSAGRTEVGPEPISADQVASDLRTIYNELTKNED